LATATTATRPPWPPFTSERAIQKVRLAEDGWNTRDPAKVALAYAIDSRWRNRSDDAPPEYRTPSAMLARLDQADRKFQAVLTDVRNRSAWDDTFVDALCEPPETFTFGGMFAYVITFNAYRRLLAIDALRRLGVNVEGFGCPMEYVATLASA